MTAAKPRCWKCSMPSDEVRILYIETLYNYAASLVELETSAGIWDIAVE